MNMSYSLNPVCAKFISKYKVFRNIDVRMFDVLLHSGTARKREATDQAVRAVRSGSSLFAKLLKASL